MEKKYTPCGGCGATNPTDRCIGCFHPFESTTNKNNDNMDPQSIVNEILKRKKLDQVTNLLMVASAKYKKYIKITVGEGTIEINLDTANIYLFKGIFGAKMYSRIVDNRTKISPVPNLHIVLDELVKDKCPVHEIKVDGE